MQEHNGRASVEPVDAARVSSWLGGIGEAPSDAAKHPPTMESFAEFQKFETERHFTALLEGSRDADIRSLIEMMTLMEDLKSKTSSIEEQSTQEAEIKMIRQEISMLVSMGNGQHLAWDSARGRSKAEQAAAPHHSAPFGRISVISSPLLLQVLSCRCLNNRD